MKFKGSRVKAKEHAYRIAVWVRTGVTAKSLSRGLTFIVHPLTFSLYPFPILYPSPFNLISAFLIFRVFMDLL
jgi:hypothetical protein